MVKIELVLIVENDETGVKTAGGISLKSAENEERLRRILAGINDPLTAKDTVLSFAREISANGQRYADEVISDLCNKLIEIANTPKDIKAVSDGN